MTTKRLAFKRPDGIIAIIHPDFRGRLARKVGREVFLSVDNIGLRLATLPPDGQIPASLEPFVVARPVGEFSRRLSLDDPAITWAETDEQFLGRVLGRNIAVGQQPTRAGGRHEPGSYPKAGDAITVVEQADIPTDLTFRGAWILGIGGKPTVDMVRAREIQKDRIRRARAPMLAALDVEFSRALGKKDQAEADRVEVERERLRKATDAPEIATAETPEELKAVWPL